MTVPDFLAPPDPELTDQGAFDSNFGTRMLAATYNLCTQLLRDRPG
jgi:hypothetical protein